MFGVSYCNVTVHKSYMRNVYYDYAYHLHLCILRMNHKKYTKLKELLNYKLKPVLSVWQNNDLFFFLQIYGPHLRPTPQSCKKWTQHVTIFLQYRHHTLVFCKVLGLHVVLFKQQKHTSKSCLFMRINKGIPSKWGSWTTLSEIDRHYCYKNNKQMYNTALTLYYIQQNQP